MTGCRAASRCVTDGSASLEYKQPRVANLTRDSKKCAVVRTGDGLQSVGAVVSVGVLVVCDHPLAASGRSVEMLRITNTMR